MDPLSSSGKPIADMGLSRDWGGQCQSASWRATTASSHWGPFPPPEQRSQAIWPLLPLVCILSAHGLAALPAVRRGQAWSYVVWRGQAWSGVVRQRQGRAKAAPRQSQGEPRYSQGRATAEPRQSYGRAKAEPRQSQGRRRWREGRAKAELRQRQEASRGRGEGEGKSRQRQANGQGGAEEGRGSLAARQPGS